MEEISCTLCGVVGLEEGFLGDTVQGGLKVGEWLSGALEYGSLGFLRMKGRRRLTVIAYRCSNCGHLELFAD